MRYCVEMKDLEILAHALAIILLRYSKSYERLDNSNYKCRRFQALQYLANEMSRNWNNTWVLFRNVSVDPEGMGITDFVSIFVNENLSVLIRFLSDIFKYCFIYDINGLVQDFSSSSALAMGLLQSCTSPSLYHERANDGLVPNWLQAKWLSKPLQSHSLTHTSVQRTWKVNLTHWGWDKMATTLADDTLKCKFVNENISISIKISLKFVPKCLINNIPTLVQIMACLNQCWLVYWRIYASLGLSELRHGQNGL